MNRCPNLSSTFLRCRQVTLHAICAIWLPEKRYMANDEKKVGLKRLMKTSKQIPECVPFIFPQPMPEQVSAQNAQKVIILSYVFFKRGNFNVTMRECTDTVRFRIQSGVLPSAQVQMRSIRVTIKTFRCWSCGNFVLGWCFGWPNKGCHIIPLNTIKLTRTSKLPQ